MRLFKKIVKYIVVILLAISIIGLVLISILSSTILDKGYIISELEKSNYYTNLYSEIESNFEKYIYQSGLDESVIKDICTISKVREDTNKIITNLYNGMQEKIDTTAIKEKLNENIETSLNGNITPSQEKAISEFVDTIANEYTQSIIHTEYEDAINSMYVKANKIVDYGKRGLIIGVAVLTFALLLLDIKRIHRFFNKLGISLFASGAFCIITNIIINCSTTVSNIKILSESISSALSNILQDVLFTILEAGLILAGVGLIFIVITNIIITKRHMKREKEINNG